MSDVRIHSNGRYKGHNSLQQVPRQFPPQTQCLQPLRKLQPLSPPHSDRELYFQFIYGFSFDARPRWACLGAATLTGCVVPSAVHSLISLVPCVRASPVLAWCSASSHSPKLLAACSFLDKSCRNCSLKKHITSLLSKICLTCSLSSPLAQRLTQHRTPTFIYCLRN